ncbi:MAG: GntR family transcriptional regulator [Gordonia sp. (in: high G+C Gram-positive bacteria)]
MGTPETQIPIPAAATTHTVSAAELVAHAGSGDAASFVDAVAALIRSGSLAPGTRLPTVRELAATGAISANSVLSAWQSLRDLGLIQTRRRGGTVVLTPHSPQQPTSFTGWHNVDFAWSAPDTRLHPDLHDALISSLTTETLHDFAREIITPRLRETVAAQWPFQAQAWTSVGGGTEALLLAVEAAAPPGSLVAVDEPLAPGVLDTLAELGVHPIGLDVDAYGPTPISLAAAIDRGVTAIILQPGAPFALRHTVTPTRIAELADIINRAVANRADGDRAGVDRQATPLWVIEDDPLGPLDNRTIPSMGAMVAGRVLKIRSFCRTYGIDVRTSVLGGPRELIERVLMLRSHGVAANSRILQNTLAYLIRSQRTAEEIRLARNRYAARRSMLLARLEHHGIHAESGPQSLVVWVKVADETKAAMALLRHGITVGTGSSAFVRDHHPPLLRLSVMQLPDDTDRIDELVGYLTDAIGPPTREYFG